MQDYFQDIATAIEGLLEPGEVYTASFSGEESDFVRFNHALVRQSGHVSQRSVSVDLIRGGRHAEASLTLGSGLGEDRARIARMLGQLRERIAALPEDPYLLYAENAPSSDEREAMEAPEAEAAIARIRERARGKDLVGIYADGDIYAGFASSLGQRNWHHARSFSLDWSLYHRADKAVKTTYSDKVWDPEGFERRLAWAEEQLAVLGRSPRTIDPGRYRVYLAPTALAELVELLSWGGFGLKSHRTRQTPLLKMIAGERRLNPALTVRENTADGLSPRFQSQGFLRPDRVTMIDGGSFSDCLVSPRSAREYGVETNGANSWEVPEALDVLGGGLPREGVLGELGTGIYVNNLWYLNYSDRNACRTTGMTRFATFWVERGQIVAPLNVMRFDETLYRALGDNLVGLTRERDLLVSTSTYSERSTESVRAPGALIEDFTLTL